ncbi:hypothetical protein ACWXVL_01435 [Mycoplasma sp. 128]|uniref:hypothetical protein n=1 Tax=Mycoplasma sp. 3341 TaxID=3447506 RepID=UPI003F6586B8
MASSLISVTITTPYGSFLETKTDIVTLKTTEGYIGLQANCLEFTAAIVTSQLFVGGSGIDASERKVFYVNKGIVHSRADRIDIIVNNISTEPLNLKTTYTEDKDSKKYSFIEEINIKKALNNSR